MPEPRVLSKPERSEVLQAFMKKKQRVSSICLKSVTDTPVITMDYKHEETVRFA